MIYTMKVLVYKKHHDGDDALHFCGKRKITDTNTHTCLTPLLHRSRHELVHAPSQRHQIARSHPDEPRTYAPASTWPTCQIFPHFGLRRQT